MPSPPQTWLYAVQVGLTGSAASSTCSFSFPLPSPLTMPSPPLTWPYAVQDGLTGSPATTCSFSFPLPVCHHGLSPTDLTMRLWCAGWVTGSPASSTCSFSFPLPSPLTMPSPPLTWPYAVQDGLTGSPASSMCSFSFPLPVCHHAFYPTDLTIGRAGWADRKSS
jgi:hypothetical protein